MDTIIQAISSVGYPIVMSLLLAWYVYYTGKTHKEEVAAMTEALNQNTLALTKLADKLEKDVKTNG